VKQLLEQERKKIKNVGPGLYFVHRALIGSSWCATGVSDRLPCPRASKHVIRDQKSVEERKWFWFKITTE